MASYSKFQAQTTMLQPLHLLESYAAGLLDRLGAKLDRQPQSLAVLTVGLTAWLFSVLLYTLHFLPVTVDQWMKTRAGDVVRMAADPLTRELREPIMAYRVVLPTLAWLFGIRGPWVLALPYLMLVVALGLVYYLFARRGKPALGLGAALGLGCTQFVLWSNNGPGSGDPLTLLAASVGLLSSNGILAAAMCALGTLNDERFVLAIPFILLWHRTIEGRSRMQTLQLAGWYALGLAVVLLVRHALTVGLIGPGIQKPQVYTDIEQRAINLFVFAVDHPFWLAANYFMSFRWFWFLIPLGWLAGKSVGVKTLERQFYLASLLMVVAASTVVWDVSRSICFGFPMLLLALAWFDQEDPRRTLRWLLICLGLCVITPAFYVAPGGLQLYLPLPLVALRLTTGWDVVDLIRTKGSGTFGVH